MKKALFSLFILFFSAVAADPTTIVIFGATGDLTDRKLMPAIRNLDREGRLPEETVIIGVGRREYSDGDFRKQMGLEGFGKKVLYQRVDFEGDPGYDELAKRLEKLGGERLYYLATQPSHFAPIVEELHARGLLSRAKLIVEKPFGRDLESAKELWRHISSRIDKNQTYLVDHYLAKQGLLNFLDFRFKNESLESVWNREHIESVEITLSEQIGVGSRGRFWEETGLLRDVFQNHMMQLLAAVAMEPPASVSADAVHREKIKVLNAIRPTLDFVRGQYEGYREEKGVAKDSNVETYAAATLFIDTPRWEDVPFHLSAGKKLPDQKTEIVVKFKEPQKTLFVRIQPNPSIYFEGSEEAINEPCCAEAYEKLISDAIQGDSSLFVHPEEHFAAWRLLSPVLENWKNNSADF